MFSDTDQFITIQVFAGLGLIYTLTIAIIYKLNTKVVDLYNQNVEPEELFSEYTNANIKQQQALYYQGITDHINKATMELFYNQSLLMIFFALIFAALLLSWLVTLDMYPILILAYMLGCGCVTLNTYITLKLSLAAICKMVIQKKNDNIYTFGYLAASSITIFTISTVLIVFSIIIYTFKCNKTKFFKNNQIFIIDMIIEENSLEENKKLFLCILGFGIGNAFSSLFYREVGSISSRGILIGGDLIVRSNYSNDEQNRIKMNLDMANIISNIYTNNIISVLDFQAVFTGFVCGYLIILSQCPEINESYRGTYFMPLFFLSFNLLIAACVSFICLKPLDNEVGLATQIAKLTKLQILICNVVSLIALIFFTVFIMPAKFSIGEKDEHTFSHQNISRSDGIWCLITGLIAQGVFLVYAEYMTSHYHSPVRSLAKKEEDENNQKQMYAFTLLQAQYQANISIYFAMFYFSIICLIGYILAGFFGIACCAMGLLTGPFSLVSINIFSGFTSEAFAMSAVGCVFNDTRNKIYQLAWTTKNYCIFPQIVVVVGILFVNLMCVGAMLIITKEEEIYLWDAYGLFGFIYGGSIVYLIKGTSTLGVKSVAENLKNNYDNAPFQGDDSNLRRVQTLVYSQYNNAIYKAAFNITISLLNLGLIGLLLGSKAIIAFLLGMNLVGMYLAFNSLIVGYSTKNAREYNRNVGELQRGDEVPIQSDILNTAVENVPGTSLIIYLIFFSLVILLGATTWDKYEYFRKWADVDQNLQKVADGSVGWVGTSLEGMEKSIEQMKERWEKMQNQYDDGEYE